MFGAPTISQEQPKLSGIPIQSSAYGMPIAIVLGTTRIPGNMTWFSDFTPIAHTSTQSTGGKGGAPEVTNTSYTYTAAITFGLCEGPVVGFGAVWRNKERYTDPSALGFSTFLGGASQAEWGWMASAHPSESLNHRRLAYVGHATYDTGSSGSLGNLSFEVIGPQRLNNGVTTLPDCDPKDMVTYLLTDTHTGAGWSSSQIGDLSQFSAACRAYGILLSLGLSEQRSAADVIQEIIRAANAQPVFSEGVLKIVPYADKSATGNGVTYTPAITPAYDLGDDDFLVHGDEDPVRWTRSAQADAYNTVQVEFRNRAADYNVEIVEAKDQASIELFGPRPMEVLRLHCIQDKTVAQTVADQVLRRTLYLRNKCQFTLGWRYADLEPMDLVTITDGDLVKQAVRITEIEENEDGELQITAEEFLGEVSTAATYSSQSANGYTPNFNVDPGNTNTPTIFEPPIALSQSPEVWVAASGGVNWGGAEVWISYDGTTYKKLQRISGGARMGTLTASLAAGSDPDITHTLSVDLSTSRGQLLGGATADADALRTLCYVDGELLAFREATLTSAFHYDLAYLRRGAYNTAAGSHASGTQFVRIDDAILRIPYTPDQVRQTIYLKFTSVNAFGLAAQSLASVSPVTYTITGAAINTVQNLALAQPFANRYCSIKWDAVTGATGYQVVVKNGSTVLRTVKTADTLYTYSYEDATADGGPYRALTFEVSAIGTTATSGVATLTASNPVPAAPSVTYTPNVQSVTVTAQPSSDTDFAGMRVWASTSTGFTPGAGNLVYDGPNTVAVVPGSGGVPLYFRVAFFDTFGKTGLNLTTEVSATPTSLSADSIPVVSSLPGTGVLGQVVLLSTDNKQYRYTSGGWATWVDGTDLLAGTVTAGKMAVSQLSAIAANMGTITAGNFTVDSSGFIRSSGATDWATGTGFWMGYDSTYGAGAYRWRVGTPGTSVVYWNGTGLVIIGADFRVDSTAYLTGTGLFAGKVSGTFKFSLGNPSGAYMAWDGSTLTVKGSVLAGDVQVDSTGNVRGGQTAYNTGVGFFLGYSGGAYKFSIGNPAGNYVTWDGSTLTISGYLVDKRAFAAGSIAVAAASTDMFMPGSATVYTKTKAITVPRGGVLRCTWDIYAGTTGSNTKSRIYINGVAASSEFIDTAIGWASHSYDATVSAGDSVELWTYWNSVQGRSRNFVLKNNFNENFFVITLDD